MLDGLDPEGQSIRSKARMASLDWEGGPVAEVRIALTAPVEPGAYRIRVEGLTHVTLDVEDMAMFAVQDA